MPAIINTNVNTLTAQRNLSTNQGSLSTSIQRLSSGLRINSAKDDAAGLAIAERFTAQIRGANQAGRNANDAISLAQTGEGALGSAGSILQRVRELAVQSANATNTSSDRKALNTESSALLAELDRIATSTQFNGQNILDGSNSSATFQVGANANQTITATTTNFRTNVYGAQLADSLSNVASATVTTGLAGTVIIQGASTQTATLTATDTAATAADAINQLTEKTGVRATARTVSQFAVTTQGAFTLAVKGNNSAAVNITFNTTASTSGGLAEAVKAFNDVSATTGISAKMNEASTAIVLTNDSGANIDLTNNSTTAAATLAAYDGPGSTTAGADTFTAGQAMAAAGGTAIAQGTLQFSSDKGFAVSGTSVMSATAQTSALNAVNTIDITTVAGATRALKIVDSAISAVATQRASFGALQSRFEQTVGNLATTSENLSASRSRIQDADFASETANLSRAQVLQQAGTAMVAQANQLPQGVLALLR